jgi:hypothetical protein
VLSTQWGSIHELDSFNIETFGENDDTLIVNCYYEDQTWAQPIELVDTLDFSDKLVQNSYYLKFRIILVPPYGITPILIDSCYYSKVMVYNDTKIDTINNEFGEFTVYPNPTSDLIFISYKLEKKQDINFEIYNEAGIRVYNKNINKTKSDNIVVDVSNFNKGIYFVKLRTKNNFITKKFIIE